MKNLPKPLHEYKRQATDEEVAKITQLMAEGKCIAEIARTMAWTTSRTKTLMKRVEVMEAAYNLRMTDVIPSGVAKLVDNFDKVVDVLSSFDKRLLALEGQMSKMNRTVRIKQVTTQKQRDTIRELRTTEKQLRAIIRKRGYAN